MKKILLLLSLLFLSTIWTNLNSMHVPFTPNEKRAAIGFSLTMAMVFILAKKYPPLLNLLHETSGIIFIIQTGKFAYDAIQFTKKHDPQDKESPAKAKVFIFANLKNLLPSFLSSLLTSYLHAAHYDNFTFKNSFLTLCKRIKHTPLQDMEKFGKYFIALSLVTAIIKASNNAATNKNQPDFEFEPIVSDLKFTDVAGAHEAKHALMEIVRMLKEPELYKASGAKLPRGVLLLGEPGCGKTLLAKALAGEANCNFFSVSGSEFHLKYVGEGQTKIRNLFAQARKFAPSIIFIDEFDALASKRDEVPGYPGYRITLNELLSQMDGMASDHNIVVIAATNLPHLLDTAAIRDGRFDRKIRVESPKTLQDRLDILKVHTAKLAADGKLPENLDFLTYIAQNSNGFSAAKLANLVNQAKLIAIGKGKNIIDFDDFKDAFKRLVDSNNAVGGII